MKKHLTTLMTLIFAATAFLPLANVYADPEPDPDYDFEACQITDLTGLETHTITFNTNGGTELEPITIIDGCSVYEAGKVPKDPVKAGSTFFGWYEDPSFPDYQKYSFHLVPDSDTILYAQFIDNNKVINNADFTVEAPEAGVEVTVTADTSQGAYFILQDPRPTVTTTSTGFEISYTRYVNLNQSWNEEFEGTFVEGEDYYIDLSLDAEDGYRFNPNGFTATINGAPAVSVDVNEYGNGTWASVTGKVTAIKSLDVQPAENTTEEAAKEVTKLINSIVNGEEVAGINDTLATQITDALNAGKTIVVEVTNPQIEADAIADDAAKIAAALEEGETVGAYYDVDIVIKIDDTATGTVTELSQPITISLPIPAGLPTIPARYTREWSITYVHNGVTGKIVPTLSGDNLEFGADRFSTYAITYQDVPTPTSPDTGNFATQNSATQNFIISFMILNLSLVGFIIRKSHIKQ